MNTETLSIEDRRAQYLLALKGLTYDNADREYVKSAVYDALERKHPGKRHTPELFVRVIRSIRIPCRRCSGTGRYITGVRNGKPVGPGGPCYRCAGEGMQTWEDGIRNSTHDRHYVPASLAC